MKKFEDYIILTYYIKAVKINFIYAISLAKINLKLKTPSRLNGVLMLNYKGLFSGLIIYFILHNGFNYSTIIS